jgi:hypothetical protein
MGRETSGRSRNPSHPSSHPTSRMIVHLTLAQWTIKPHRMLSSCGDYQTLGDCSLPIDFIAR